jgi:hypothetical protein
LASEGADILIPTKEPWSAPEVHPRYFSFDDAVKTDIFSFGLLAFWLLFFENLHKDMSDGYEIDENSTESITHAEDIYAETIRILKIGQSDGALSLFVSAMLENDQRLDVVQKHTARNFFEKTLADETLRCKNLEDLFTGVRYEQSQSYSPNFGI